MSGKFPIVAIVGRTNVGKSALFNTIVGKRLAIVEDMPGVTRDRNTAMVSRWDFPFTLIDTGGLVGEEHDELHVSVREQAELAIAEADLLLVVFDAKDGLHPLDAEVVQTVRKSNKPAIFVANKCEVQEHVVRSNELYGLGLEEIEQVSAAHRVGIKNLVQKIKDTLEKNDLLGEKSAPIEALPIKIALIGKPNTGKSTLINKIIGEKRVVAADLAGTTRDNIQIPFNFRGQELVLIDTAGLRRKARIADFSVERFSNLRALKALADCDVAALLLDATQGLPSDQDAKLAEHIHERGRGFVIVVNKWDAIEKDHHSAKEFKDAVKTVFRFAPYAPVVFASALTGRGCPKIVEKALEVYKTSCSRIPTSELNKTLKQAFQRKPPPVHRGEPIKLYFATQIDSAPPTFVLFLNQPKEIPDSYIRYVKKSLRDVYPFEGSDLKLILRKRTSKADRVVSQSESRR